MVKSTREYRDSSIPKYNKNLGRNRDKNFIKKASEFKTNINNNRIEILKFDNNTQTCPNFNEFMKYVKEQLEDNYEGSQIYLNADYSEEEVNPLDKKYRIKNSDSIEVRNWKAALLKNDIRRVDERKRKMEDSQPAVYNLIWNLLSKTSQYKVKAHKDYKTKCCNDKVQPPIKSPHDLFNIIRETHQGFVGGNTGSVSMARTQLKIELATMYQREGELLGTWAQRLEELQEKEAGIVTRMCQVFDDNGYPAVDERGENVYSYVNEDSDYANIFLMHLTDTYSEAKAYFLNRLNAGEIEEPSNIAEAYTTVDRFVSSSMLKRKESKKVLKTSVKKKGRTDRGSDSSSPGRGFDADDDADSDTADKGRGIDSGRKKGTPGDCFVCLDKGIKKKDLKHWTDDCPLAKNMPKKEVAAAINRQKEVRKRVRDDGDGDDDRDGNVFDASADRPKKGKGKRARSAGTK